MPRATVLMFPGQGAQRPGMGAPWRESPSWDLVGRLGDWTEVDLAHLLISADESELRRTDRAQLAVFAMGVLAYTEAMRLGVGEDAVGYAGHSLGEYVALYASGALGLRECAVLVSERGAAMLRAARRRPGAMAALIGEGAGEGGAERIIEHCHAAGDSVWIANLNGPGQVVVSGTESGIDAVAARAVVEGLRCVRILVGGAFHSPLMAPAAQSFRRLLRVAPFAPSHAPVASNVDGAVHTEGAAWPDLMTTQITSPVRWHQCVRTFIDRCGATRFIELGAGRTLAGLTARIAPNIDVSSAGTPEQIAALARVAV